MHVTAASGLAAILKCWLYANFYRLPPPFAEDSRGSSGIGTGKSIGLAKGILLPAEAVDPNRTRPFVGFDMSKEDMRTTSPRAVMDMNATGTRR